jgi:NTP pyrophosphatase (non-canonical NTP hydrolase)
VDLAQLQDVIARTYGDLDRDRGVPGTVAWLTEELGELAQALRKGTREQIELEFSDVLAWVATLANLVDVDLSAVIERYRDGCPKCAGVPCTCSIPAYSAAGGT